MATSSETIYSGHFMVSSLNDEEDTESGVRNDNEPNGQPSSLSLTPDKRGYNFDNVNRQPSRTYQFNRANFLALDPNLAKMFDCMTLAYRFERVLLTFFLHTSLGTTPKSGPKSF